MSPCLVENHVRLEHSFSDCGQICFVKAARRAIVVLVFVGIGVSIVVGGHVRFWRPLAIKVAAVQPRPPKVVEPPRWDDGSTRDVECPAQAAPGAEPIEVGLCYVVSRPQEFACRRVRFRATVLSDCMHGTLLTDSRCERGILPEVSQRGDRTVEPFLESICAEMPSSLDVMRMATFTGYFRLRERNTATIFVLDVESVQGIRISPKHRPSDRTPGNSIR